MPTYVVLYRFTDQGRKGIRRTLSRTEEIRKMNEGLGFEILGTYWTVGHYDIVSIVEAPSEAAMVAGLFNIAESGNVTSETLRAFTAKEMEYILVNPDRMA